MRKLTFMMLALGVFVGAANADERVFSGDIYDIYYTDPVPVGDGSEDLHSFIIRAVNTTGIYGYNPHWFYGASPGYTGITSDTGLLHQHRGPLDTPEPSIIPAAVVDFINPIDTHFLYDATATVYVPASENYLTDSSETAFGYYGETWFGDRLTGEVVVVEQGDTWDIAQIVTSGPNTDHIRLNFWLEGTLGGEVIDVPEPATLSLLTLCAGLALLRKRTK